jgi:sugar lactone lactonase YvrE
MYVLGKTNNSVYEYDLSTSWDLSTAQYNNVSFSIATQEGNAFGLAFSSTGDKMYVIGLTSDRIHEYDLSTNWDVSTAQYNNVRFSVTLQEGTPEGIAFSSTGDKMYVVGSTSDSVYEYDLSTNWDLSTVQYNSVSLSVASQETTPTGLAFTSTGNKIYVIGATSDSVYEYDLSTNWDLSSASYNNVSFRVASQNGSPEGVAFSSIGDKMYMIGFSGGTIFQYSV